MMKSWLWLIDFIKEPFISTFITSTSASADVLVSKEMFFVFPFRKEKKHVEST